MKEKKNVQGIVLKDVCFSYGETMVLRNLSYHFEKTGLYVILGSSGSGKTTLISLIAGLLSPQSGKIVSSFAKPPSLVFQSPELLDYLTVEENVSLPLLFERKGKKNIPEKIQKALMDVGLVGYENRDVRQLSGGEQMRVSIARALADASSVLILDEPTGQLDEENSLAIYAILKKLSINHLILLVTHDEKNSLMLSNHILRLQNGFLKGSPSLPKDSHESFPIPEKRMLSLQDSFLLNGRFLRKRGFRVFLATFFLAFSLTLFYLGFSLNAHLDTSLNAIFSEYYGSEVTEVSFKEKVATVGHMALAKFSVPEKRKLYTLGIYDLFPSLTYFLPSTQSLYWNEKENAVSFLPVLKERKERLRTGSGFSDAHSVVVNDSLLTAFGMSEAQAIGKFFSLSHATIVKSKSYRGSDYVTLNYTFVITGISKEKEAFNEPTIYYDYMALYQKLSHVYLPSLSEEIGNFVSVTDLLENDYLRADDYRGDCLLFQCDSVKALVEKGENIYPETIRIRSKSHEIRKSTETIVSSLTQVLNVFVILNLLMAFMLEFLTIYSLYEDNLRLFALTAVFTQRPRALFRLAIGMGGILLSLTGLEILWLGLLGSRFLNAVLIANHYPTFLPDFDSMAFFLCLFLVLLISLPAILLPLQKLRKKEIKHELDGED